VAAAYEYSPFGEILRAGGSMAKANPFRFSSKFTDDESGLIYYGHRYFSPELGRFINRDPSEEQGGANLYSFCGNNGVSAWDRLGLDGPSQSSQSEVVVLGKFVVTAPRDNSGSNLDSIGIYISVGGSGGNSVVGVLSDNRSYTRQVDNVRDAERIRKILLKRNGSVRFEPAMLAVLIRIEPEDTAVDPYSEADYGNRLGDKMPAPDQFDDPRTYRYAKAWILQDGNKVMIYVPVIYRGPSVTKENISRFENGVKKYWDGVKEKYEVSVTFMPGPVDRGLKFGTIVYMADAGQSRSWFYGAEGWGLIAYNTEGARDQTAAHEFGHFMGSRLHYDRPGAVEYPNNIMTGPDGVVEPINIEEAIERWGGFKSQGFKP
jgi:RHS repeat-associated protein